MARRVGIAWVVVTFGLGAIVGGLAGALFATSKFQIVESEAMASASADALYPLVPLLVSLNEEDLSEFESVARQSLTKGVIIMSRDLTWFSEQKREGIEGILRSIAHHREELGLGEFADPPNDIVEEILAAYSN